MTISTVNIIYLVSSICFIFALKGLSSPSDARRGNFIGILGMVIALIACLSLPEFHNKSLVIFAILSGGIVGASIALKIKMTSMPQLVAAFHSLVGIAAVFVAIAAYLNPEGFGIGILEHIKTSSLVEMSIGASIGAITFTGSVIAFGKLQGIISSKMFKFPAQKFVTIGSFLLLLFLITSFVNNHSLFTFIIMITLSLFVGILLILPVGGADMPVVVSMLNSYSGWAACGIGFTLDNSLLIITGALVGASGAILSYVMCHAMNRSLFKVIFGALLQDGKSAKTSSTEERNVNISSAEDAGFMMKNASSVIIVPGYGMAVAGAQHAIKDLVNLLEKNKVEVKFAIHPVAGRMPGHMNVLLAEADIPYEQVFELEDINRDFSSTDIALVIGANDVTNPAAKNDKNSPIYGMPILDVENAKTVYFIKRSMAAGYAGVENELFYRDNTMMLFGDAKKVVENIVKNIES